MFADIVILYFLGLVTLLLSYFLGLGLFRFRNGNVFLSFFLGYLLIIATYAIFKARFNSVGIFVLLWVLGYIFVIGKQKESPLIQKKEYTQHLLIISSLWSLIFALKASYFWNSAYNCPNLLFIDNEFYIKI